MNVLTRYSHPPSQRKSLLNSFKYLTLIASSFTLVACGGSDSASDTTEPALVQQSSEDNTVQQPTEDNTAPQVTLNGDSNIIVGLGRAYRELGASAVDDIDGVLTVITPSTLVDSDTLGEYRLSYQATDTSGNATTIIRTVTVVEPRPFISTWKTDVTGGLSQANQVTISTQDNRFSYDYSINWGDGHVEQNQTGDITHTYATEGTYTITLDGDFPAFSSYFKDEKKLQSIEQWGDIKWLSMADAFYGALNMVNKTSDTPDLRLVTKMDYMFAEALLFDADLSLWDVSNVTSFYYMFENADSFSGDISGWDISNVTDMTGMFHNLTLSSENYDALLIGWSQQQVQHNVRFDAGNSLYSPAAQAARALLVDDYNWNISDAGLAP